MNLDAALKEARSGGVTTLAALRALIYLRSENGCQMTPLADHLGITTAGATGVADALEKAGMAKRMSLEDRRAVLLYLTDAGHALISAFNLT